MLPIAFGVLLIAPPLQHIPATLARVHVTLLPPKTSAPCGTC
jgi:hypothetical protein